MKPKITISTGSVCSELRKQYSKLGLPRKKKVPRACEQDSPEVQDQRRAFCEALAGVDPQRLVFVDECGANTAMTRTYGRAPAGQRVYSDAPGRWDSITLTCGMRLSGPMAAEVFPGATNTVMFEDYVEEVLVPELRPGDVVICPQVAAAQAEQAGHAAEDEIDLLCTHGILHLLGYDHADPEEHAKMFGLQDRLLASWRAGADGDGSEGPG